MGKAVIRSATLILLKLASCSRFFASTAKRPSSGLADMLKKPDLAGHVMNNVFFDTCVYHQPGVNLLADVIDNKNILFGSEMVGAVRGIDPTTGHYFDDTKRYVDALDISDNERHMIFEGNARRVFPRLDAQLKARGL